MNPTGLSAHHSTGPLSSARSAATSVGACPEMTALAILVGSLAALRTPTAGNDARLSDWIDRARAEDLPRLHAYTRGLQFDRETVNAARTQPFHSGWIEGVNTKTKTIKRQICGRAGFPLLRHRILLG
ncbi:hypothetical protein GCM10022222_52110 [Amycolatopsis ultiminotia]|uniref:Transposase IS204/IS1001/IS1096/IS1165 DDE domain-containing protein n=1 Tax=Amycolatopsis ultiminotia TaxID=543629 RepID=A0ABP6X857_9PSEU